jgi:hypothetical protein
MVNAPYSFDDGYQIFGVTCCLFQQDSQNMEIVTLSVALVNFTKLCSIITQKTMILFFVILKASYLTCRPSIVSLGGGCKTTSKPMVRGSLSEIFLAGSHHCIIKWACPIMLCYVLLREAECYFTVTNWIPLVAWLYHCLCNSSHNNNSPHPQNNDSTQCHVIADVHESL